MAIDREATLKNAEKFLRVGRLDAAIAEYARVVEDQPRDWNSANMLGDLYIRAGQPDRAVPLYRRIAEHLLREGFYPKAGALFKKVLKIAPGDEEAHLRLAEISAKQGLMADARAYYSIVERHRRQAGNTDGADDILVTLGALDPEDLGARLTAAEVAARRGRTAEAAAGYRALYDDYLAMGQHAEAVSALRECMRLQPDDPDATLLLPLAGLELSDGRLDAGMDALRAYLASGGDAMAVVDLGRKISESSPDGGAACADLAVDKLVQTGAFAAAADVLREFAGRVPGRVDLPLRLVEVCVDGELEKETYEAQALLAEAYLHSGQAAEARVIAEDLVGRDPGNPGHASKLRRALEMLGVADIDAVIADAAASDGSADPIVDAPDGQQEEVPLPGPDVAGPATAEADSPSHHDVVTADNLRQDAAVEIDLTTALGALEGAIAAPLAPPPDTRTLDSVFEGLRATAAEEGDDESAEHLELARTYLEMGMPDEAVGSLEVAARSPRLRFVASSMLAQIHRDSSDLTRAIECFERAAEAPAPSAEDGHALLYDLGDLLETVGETARALAVFLELLTDAPGFRDVAERVARLSRAETEG